MHSLQQLKQDMNLLKVYNFFSFFKKDTWSITKCIWDHTKIVLGNNFQCITIMFYNCMASWGGWFIFAPDCYRRLPLIPVSCTHMKFVTYLQNILLILVKKDNQLLTVFELNWVEPA